MIKEPVKYCKPLKCGGAFIWVITLMLFHSPIKMDSQIKRMPTFGLCIINNNMINDKYFNNNN